MIGRYFAPPGPATCCCTFRRKARPDKEGSQRRQQLPSQQGEEEDQKRKKYELQITEDLEEFVESTNEMSEAANGETISKAPKKRSAELKTGAKQVPAKKRLEPKTLGPVREPEPWEWISMNKCLVVASILALLSMGFQILEDVVDPDNELPEMGNGLFMPPESRPPEVPPDELPEPWFFESWFEASEPEPEEEDGIAPTPAPVMVELKMKPEKPSKPTLPRKSEVEKRRPEKEKKDSPPAKIEKVKPEKTSKASSEPRDKHHQTKANKPWKELKEAVAKREDNDFQIKERKVRGASPGEKRKEFKKDKGENGRSLQWSKRDRSEKTARGQGEEHSKYALKKGPLEDRRRNEHTPQQEQKWPRKENLRGLNGSSRQNTPHKFFPKKEDEKRRFFPKTKDGAFKTHD